uniref:Uncharacterized protein n=1 Tax=Capra hircus TaxID=9925 RepID=A0A8C2PAH0_CAPHI
MAWQNLGEKEASDTRSFGVRTSTGIKGLQTVTSAPAVREDVYLFVRGTPEEYIAKVKEYNTNSAIVANARRLKDRVDEKLTEEDKQNALSILNKIYSSSLC